MGNGVQRAALGVLAVLLLAGTLAAAVGARVDSTPNYTLLGYVDTPGGLPVPAGVTVDLISSATHQTYQTTTSTNSGQFSFSSNGNAPDLAPGWWGLWVPAQSHVSLFGGVPYAVLPANQSPQYMYENASTLVTTNSVTLHGVALVQYNASISGTVKYNGQAQGGAQITLLAPDYNGFVLANNTSASIKTNTTAVGFYNLSVPWGNWILETRLPGTPDTYNLTQVSVSRMSTTLSPVLSTSKSYVTWGFVNSGASHVPNGGNVTVFDPATGAIWSQRTDPGGFYTIGTYGTGTFDVILSTVGYGTVSYPLSVSPSNPTGGPNPHNVQVPKLAAPPTSCQTTLNWSSGFPKLNVSTACVLSNDSVFPELANASVGQLWGQAALDWQHNLTFLASNLPALERWINGSGPFFAAGQASTNVNGSTYGQPNNDSFTASSTCSGSCGMSSPATLSYSWKQSYNVSASSKLATNAKSYAFAFNFRHPTNSQSFNYTVVLPPNYVLSAGASVPGQTALVPAGPGGTWTSFILVSKPSTSPSGTASFTAVKYGNVTAAVNISSSQFTWSEKNVVNTTRTGYAAIAATNENLTFSALNSTFPSGTNGTLYAWNFGDATMKNTTTPTTYHTYGASGAFAGSVTVTSSGGRTSSAPFHVYVGSNPPTAHISVNDTKLETSSNGVPYLVVNWSTPLQFNASGSTSTLYTGATVPGVISIAAFNISNYGGGSTVKNVTRASGHNPFENDTMTFLGGGAYLTQPTANGTPISIAFYGWQYNVSLTVWDAGGHSAKALLVVLVRDTQKPTPVLALKDAKGKPIPASGIVEGSNHTAFVQIAFTNTTDPNNGSVVWYNVTIKDPKNTSVNMTIPIASSGPGYATPSPLGEWLAPQRAPYTVNLTVTDRAGNKAWTQSTLQIATNTSNRPVLVVANLTAPTTMTDGTSYPVWVNVTNTVGKYSTAEGVQVRFYLLPPSGTGVPITIGGTVTFTGYNSTGALNSTPIGTGSIRLPYNHTVRAEIQWDPARTGTWALWVNATATNEFASNYDSGLNTAHVTVTLNANPIIQYEEYGAIGAAAVLIFVAIVFWYRRRGTKPSGKSTSGGRLERGAKKDEDDEE